MISEKREERAAELRETYGVTVTGNAEAVADADVVLLVVKPQDVPALLDEIAGSVRTDATVVSLAAGITIDTMTSALPDGIAVIRAMPNTPALVGEGMFGISPGPGVSDEQVATSRRCSSRAARSWSSTSRSRTPSRRSPAPGRHTSSISPRR